MTMTARSDWFRGPLLSRHFAEQVMPRAFATRLGEASADGAQRRLRRWLAVAESVLGPASGVRAICDVGAVPFFTALGYRVRSIAPKGDPAWLVGAVEGARGVVLPLVIAVWEARLDQTWRVALRMGDVSMGASSMGASSMAAISTVVSAAAASSMAAASMGASPAAASSKAASCTTSPARGAPAGEVGRDRWAFAFNGRSLRLMDLDRPYARRFIEFDLAETIPDASRCRLLWAVARPAAFAKTTTAAVTVAARGTMRRPLLGEIVEACDAHGLSVREALQGGVREALELLCAELARAARRSRDGTAADVVSQGLTLLYRVLFLLFAEARSLVPVWHPLYRDSYTIGTLHRHAERAAPRGLWDALQAISRLAHAGCETDEFSMTAFNSQLFSPDCAPLVDRARIDSATIGQVLRALMTTPGRPGRGRERITYADLGVEQLGAVYERILDYAPELEEATAARLERRTHGPPGSPSQSLEHTEANRQMNALSSETKARSSQARAESSTGVERRTRGPSGAAQDRANPEVRRHPSAQSSMPTEATAARLERRTQEPPGARAQERATPEMRPSSQPSAMSVQTDPREGRRTADLQDRPSSRQPPSRRPPSSRRPSSRRKESGTFYTPRGLADALVRDTLAPLVATASADRILRLRVLDPAMGSGAFLVSACRFLAHAYEQALAREDRELPATDAARAEIRRTIARHCLFGVDLNPMAVQLARLSLWLTTLTTDAPLTFLDHHLRVGDSLVGASLDDLARRLPAHSGSGRGGSGRGGGGRTRTATLPLFSHEDTSGLMRAILPSRARLAEEEDDRPETVHAKERLLATLTRDSALGAWLTLADLWCASWFWTDQPPPQTAWAALCDQVLRGRSVLPAHTAAAWLAEAHDVARRQRFFHWTLEFPEVFFDASGEPLANGGFDAIVGNPPWDMVRDDGEETRERPAAALMRFVRETGIYDTGEAHANSYQLFVDRSLSLLRRDGGRLGLVVPWGLAADHGSARLRRRLLEGCDVDTMISFDNRDGLFPIHRSLRFLLFTCTSGRPTTEVACRFGERDPAVLDGATAARAPLRMSPSLLLRVSGEGRAFPDVRSREGLALLERLHATWPSLTSADGWNVAFGRELHASDDRAWFAAAAAAAGAAADGDGGDRWPVIEGKHLQPFAVHPGDARFVVPAQHMEAVRARVPAVARHRLAYRDVSSATNRTTLIAAIVPPFVITTHTLFCLRSPLDLDAQHALCALMNSFVANYLVRLRVSTHVTLALLDHLPFPLPSAEIVGQLAALARDARPSSRARLHALAARTYGLTADDFRHVLSTFPLVAAAEKEAALSAFAASAAPCSHSG